MELVIAITISSVLVVGIHSCLSIAMRSFPDPRGLAAMALEGSRIVDQLTTDLETALYITERSATALGFTVPDRDGDGIAERIRYAWSGEPGGRLIWQYNGGPEVKLAESVELFSLTPAFRTVAESYPAVGVEDIEESLLIDYFSTSGLGNNDVTLASWVAQYFTLTLPADTYAWRPTRVRFMAKRNSVPGVTLVQMRPADAMLKPTATVVEQLTLSDSAMTTSYAWQEFAFTQLEPLVAGAGICLVLQHQTGSKSVTVQSAGGNAGLEKTNNSGSTWSYDSAKCLVAQLYGKSTRSDGTLTLNRSYLTAMDIALQMTATSPMLHSSAALLNRPELLSAKWELKFDQDPTRIDINGDGQADWGLDGGGGFDMGSIADGGWQTSGLTLRTQPECDFAKTTIVDLTFQNTSVGGHGAQFQINAMRSGSSCASLLVTLQKQVDGNQTLTLSSKSFRAQPKTLTSIPGLPSQPVSLRLIIDPEHWSVSMRVNGVQYGTHAVTPTASGDAGFASVGSDGGSSQFSYVQIRVQE